MTLDFPTSPTNGQVYPASGPVQFQFTTGKGWKRLGGSSYLQFTSVEVATGSLAAGASEDLSLPAGTRFILLSITASTPAWVRVYGTSAARTADASRPSPGGTLPAAGTEFYCEVATTTTPQTIRAAPVAPLVQGTTGNAFLRVRNEDVTTRTITLTFATIKLED